MGIVSQFKRKLWIVDYYNAKLQRIPLICIVLTNNIHQNQSWGLTTRREVDSLMKDIDDIGKRLLKLDSIITLKSFIDKPSYKHMLELTKIWQFIMDVIHKCGCSIDMFREIFDIENTDFWELHKNIFTITDIHHITKEKEEKSYIDLCELANNEGAEDYEEHPFVSRKYPLISLSLIEKTSGAYICYHRDDAFIKISGIYHDDNFNFIRKLEQNKEKDESIIERICKLKIDSEFAKKYYNTLSLRDFLAYSEDEIVGKIISAHREYKRLKGKELKEIVMDFNVASRESRIRFVCILASGGDKERLLVTSLFSAISSMWPISEVKSFTQRLPWDVQDLIVGSVSMIEEFQRILTISVDEIPIEEQIVMMEAPDEIKSKATNKLKEIKSSRENSAKAEQYLKGLLKIPFGKYRKEEMFGFIEDFGKDYMDALDMLIEKTSEAHPSVDVTKFKEYQYKFKSPHSFSSVTKMVKCISSDGLSCINELLQDDNLKNNRAQYLTFIGSWLTLTEKHQDWVEYIKDRKNYLNKTKEILDECVHGHDEAKTKIQRLVGQWMNGQIEGAVFGFQGPPGVGKTTLAKEGLSKCLVDEAGEPRPFCFLPLGGASNGSILEGHGYTYVGSTWGRIVDMLMSSKCMNPIIYIDELDKVSHTEHGREIIGILTHITDPSQNKEFNDRYFSGIDIDLSKVLFIFSYNDAASIDGVLRDRITEINVDPLTVHDKKIIVQKHVIPELTKLIGFKDNDLLMGSKTVEHVIETYTYEPGVRKLKEILTDIFRDVNMNSIVDGHILLPYTVSMEDVDRVMHNKHKVRIKKISPVPRVGVINGLYATAGGSGGLTIIQVLETPSKGEITLELTGLQGETMKESMACAKTTALSLLNEVQKLKIKGKDGFGLHIHCPAGGTKKDGPSAGAAITCAILSRILNIPTVNTVAMTGEIDLYGNVTAIGGLDCKITGAHRAGVKKVLCPKDNEHDYNLFIEHLKKNKENTDDYPEIVLVETIFDVIPHVFDVNLDDYFCKSWF